MAALSSGIICLSVCALVALIIAIPTFLTGCHDVLQPNCINYYVKDVTIYNYIVKNRECSICEYYKTDCDCVSSILSNTTTNITVTTTPCTIKCHTYCQYYRHYICYDSYAIGKYETYGVNHTKDCSFKAANGDPTYSQALTEAQNRYWLGKTMVMYIDKNTGSCNDKTDVEARAIVGFTFFLICGIFLSVICFFALKYKYKQNLVRNTYLPINNPPPYKSFSSKPPPYESIQTI